jgi:hypothetical protein
MSRLSFSKAAMLPLGRCKVTDAMLSVRYVTACELLRDEGFLAGKKPTI